MIDGRRDRRSHMRERLPTPPACSLHALVHRPAVDQHAERAVF